MMNVKIVVNSKERDGINAVAKTVARRLNYTYIDSVAMMRAITYKALKNNIDINDPIELELMVKFTSISFVPSVNGQLTYLDGVNVTDLIHSKEVSSNIMQVASYKNVHSTLRFIKRELSSIGIVVIDYYDVAEFPFNTGTLPFEMFNAFIVNVDDMSIDEIVNEVSEIVEMELSLVH